MARKWRRFTGRSEAERTVTLPAGTRLYRHDPGNPNGPARERVLDQDIVVSADQYNGETTVELGGWEYEIDDGRWD